MSIVQTAKENSLDVEKYLNYVLTKINTAKISDLKDLLPYSDKIPNEFIVNVTWINAYFNSSFIAYIVINCS